ncbi:TadE/TadG family type IV pilus assembly protein [Mycobacterium sp.]|uniref:TadE/TadG family type IV pilus assembly protein n=1 Tax=Mycobacterium sp. TaxID=1785 RepID=UPI002D993214|nr:TadE/TadG family type IV pilus assembly protein [Mycobacterium sp.]
MRRHLHRGERRGQTLVEFALILPIFILLLVGIVDFGRAIYAYNTLSNASREAVRIAIVDQNCTHIVDEAIDHAVSLGLSTGDVEVEFASADLSTVTACNNTEQSLGRVAIVTTNYSYTAATPIIGNLVGVINMQAVTRQPVEWGNVAP